MIGNRLGHYEIIRQLGKGGMGEVYVAHDDKLNREVALKVLPSDLANDPDRLQRFEREAKMVAALNHPNIVTIYSVEEADSVRFMTMELVRGKTLDELIPADGMSVPAFLDVAVPLADAVAAAHQKDIQHRDLKPANVMVDDEGRVKVLDFGLAKIQQRDAGPDGMTQMMTGQITGEGKILGTVSYMSPEQAEGRTQDHRSDIFSLGILMYEMLTGRRPFDGDTNLSILSAILKDEPDSVSDVRTMVPIPIARLIQRTLAKKPDQRFQSAGDLKQDLATIKRDLETGEAIQSGMYSDIHSISAPPARPWWRGPVGIAVGAAAAIAALIVVLPALTGPGRGGAAPRVVPAAAEMRPSIAVFYFDNISADAEFDWLRTGLTDMLVTDLSQAPHLRVLATDRLYAMLAEMGRLEDRTTSADVVRQIGRQAEMSTAVVGSFARAGDRIRINARVQDARTAEVLDSGSVEGQAEEIFKLVDELSEWVASTFEMTAADVEMTPAMAEAGMGDRALEEVTTHNVEAFRLFAQADGLIRGSRPDSAIPLLERALELDPNFAMALAKLSVAHGNENHQEMAREYARRAFEHSDRLPPRERFYIRGRHFSMSPELTGRSLQEYTKAVEMFPDHTAARHNLAMQLINLDRVDEAVQHFEVLRQQRTPFASSYSQLARGYVSQGRFDEAVDAMNEFVVANPENADGRRQLAEMLIRSGRIEAALSELDIADSVQMSAPNSAGRWAALVVAERWDEARKVTADMVANTADPQSQSLGGRQQVFEELYFGRPSAANAVFDRGLAQTPRGTSGWKDLISGRLAYGHEISDGAGLLRDAALLRETGAPEVMQNVAFAEAVGHTLRGDAVRAAAARAEFDALIAPLPLSERVRRRIDAQMTGLLAWAAGDYTTAVQHLGVSIDLFVNPEHDETGGQVHFAYGESLWRTGRKPEAVVQFERVLNANVMRISSPVLWLRAMHYLGQYHAERGQRDIAEGHYRRFLRYWGEGEIDRERVARARAYVGE